MALATAAAGAASDFEQLSVTAAAVSLTAAKITSGAVRSGKVLIDVETNPIRYCLDGTAPTATTGMVAASGTRITVDNPADVANLKMIQTAAGAATANVTYFRERDSL